MGCKELEKQIEKLKADNEELKQKLELRQANNLASDEFWMNDVFVEDYPFVKENILKELADYYFILEQLPSIYMEITGGRLSKTNYFARGVLDAYNDSISDYTEEVFKRDNCLNVIREIVEEDVTDSTSKRILKVMEEYL